MGTSEESDNMKLLLFLVLATVAICHPARKKAPYEPQKYSDNPIETSGSRRNEHDAEMKILSDEFDDELFNKNKFRSTRSLDKKTFGVRPDTPSRRQQPRAARSGPAASFIRPS